MKKLILKRKKRKILIQDKFIYFSIDKKIIKLIIAKMIFFIFFLIVFTMEKNIKF